MSQLARTGSGTATGAVTCGLQARNLMFTGREDIMEQLEKALIPAGSDPFPAPTTRRSCVLHAIGGMGKTQIALEYTHRYAEHYTHIFWVRAETEAVLAESFLDILEKVGIDGGSAAIDKRIEMVREYLQKTCTIQSQIAVRTSCLLI